MAKPAHQKGLLAPTQLFKWASSDSVTLYKRSIRVRTKAELLKLSCIRRADSEEPLFSLYPAIPLGQLEIQGFRCQHG
jgi:hypothetical protein